MFLTFFASLLKVRFKMEITKLRKWILQSFKLHGYSVRPDAASYLATQFLPINAQDRQKWMEKIAGHIQKLNLKTLVVDKNHIELCVQECTRKQPSTETIWNVINVFEAPCFTYSAERSKFVKDELFYSNGLFPPASVKSTMYKRRYTSVMQRTLRHDLFRQQLVAGAEKPKFSLKTIEWFLCSTGRVENAVIVGLFVQKSDSIYHIEDLTGSLQLDLSDVKFHDGLFPEHSFILIEGIYEDKIFYVHGLGFPPGESKKKSRPYFGNLNTFGGLAEVSLCQSGSLLKVQNDNPDAMIVFISDVWLDELQVMRKLDTLFSGYSQHPPFAFVLMGNFLSSNMGSSHASQLKAKFKALADLILSYPSIAGKSHFVFIPGPTDPGSPLILPRAPLPESITEELRTKMPKAIMATNPCRIQYCTREIIVIREDLITKMCRNTVHFPKSDEIPNHFVKTIICQGTLVPMSLNVCPVYWNYSHGLDIYPLPDLIVTADQFNSFTENYMDCIVVNPGGFMKNKFSFRVYIPATNQVEESIIPDEP